MLPRVDYLLGWTLATALAVVVSQALARPDGSIALIWLGNAVQLAALLLAPKRHWLVLMTAFAVIQATVLYAWWSPLGMAVGGTVANTVEVLLAAYVLAPDRDWIEGRLDRLSSWIRFGVWGVVIAPVIGTAIGTAAVVMFYELPPTYGVISNTAIQWYITDAMAISVVVPLILRLRPRGLRPLRNRNEAVRAGITLTVLILVSVVVFSHESFLPLFLVPLPLVVLLFRSGFAGLAVGMAVLTAIALGLTRAGYGPLQVVADGDPTRALLPCQIFLITVFALVVVVAALLDERQRHEVMENASFDVYGLMATLSGDIVVVFEPEGWLLHCTPTVGELLGVDDPVMRGMGWMDLVHPDDRTIARHMLADVARSGLVDDTFRMRHTNGSWRWFAVQLRRSGGGAALDYLVVGMIRDVTDQRDLEDSLRARANELATIAHTDPLTGLPNRRRLAERRDSAWRDAVRRGEPLSLLVIDVDRFKSYNDEYGHLAGDECLVRVAQAIAWATRRPTDICGRFGGEEFVAILPATSEDGARRVAEKIRAAVQNLSVTHAGNEAQVVTVSVGASTWVPAPGDGLAPVAERTSDRLNGSDELFRAADAALYQAKSGGRNTVVSAPLPGPGARSQGVHS